jgi:1,2-diacylglycerol 3-alpha-glucosyltransferase
MKVAALFDSFGPYHVARLDALGAMTSTLGLETASHSAIYAWDPVDGPTQFQRETLFAARDSSARDPEKIRQRMSVALDSFSPDVILVPGWAGRSVFALVAWAREHSVPMVMMSESTISDSVRSPLKEGLKRLYVGGFAAGFVGSLPQRTYLSSLGIAPERIALGYNAVDNAWFEAGAAAVRRAPEAARARLGVPERFLLASARFIGIKNLDGLLIGYAQFLAESPASTLDLVLLGDGLEREALNGLALKLGISARVHMPGFKQYEELPTYYGLAEGFIHVSRIEPWGLVVNEAMAAGLPVIVSQECGCASTLVEPGQNGWLVAAGDSGAIARAISLLDQATPEQRAAMAENSRAIVGRWGPERFAAGALEAAEIAIRHHGDAGGFLHDGLRMMLQRLA